MPAHRMVANRKGEAPMRAAKPSETMSEVAEKDACRRSQPGPSARRNRLGRDQQHVGPGRADERNNGCGEEQERVRAHARNLKLSLAQHAFVHFQIFRYRSTYDYDFTN